MAATMIGLSERRSTHALDRRSCQRFQDVICLYWLQENSQRRMTLVVHRDKRANDHDHLSYKVLPAIPVQLREFLRGGWQEQQTPIKVRLDGDKPQIRGIGSEKLEDIAKPFMDVFPEEEQNALAKCRAHLDRPFVKGRHCCLRMPWVLQIAFLLICCVGSVRSFHNHHILVFPNMGNPFFRHSTTGGRRYNPITQHYYFACHTFATRSKEILDVESTTRESKRKTTKSHVEKEQTTVKVKGQRNTTKTSKEKETTKTKPIKAPTKINKLSTKKTCKSTTKVKLKKIPKKWHWKGDDDDDDTNSNAVEIAEERIKLVHFTVHGNPLPLRRHRTARGFMYNPSSESQASFRNVTTEILDSMAPPQLFQDNTNTKMNGKSSSSLLSLPLYSKEQPLVMSILFRMKRPNHHFIGNKPGPGRLRDTAPLETALTRSDVDNLAKFVLDSMNGILYDDDHQVCSLHITKLMDNRGHCRGSTQICIRPLMGEQDVPVILENSFIFKHNNFVPTGHESN